jgi:hypothetical protein
MLYKAICVVNKEKTVFSVLGDQLCVASRNYFKELTVAKQQVF